jgi:pimeloyl-ACP methyl ester carboxylesterase
VSKTDTVITKYGVTIYFKDWGNGQPIVFSHGWPLSSDDWDALAADIINTDLLAFIKQ